ncbi:MAG: cryptochrome/photolyase family protein [Pseudomonadota bacterium]
MTGPTLILILGDQLTPEISSLRGRKPDDSVILMAEVREEATYVRHHKKKIAFIFSAMRHFANAMRDAGWTVDYRRYDAEDNAGDLAGEVARAIDTHKASSVIVTEPGEYRLLAEMQGWQDRFDIPVTISSDDRFLASHEDFARWAEGRKQLRMEYFYREMRKNKGLLMTKDGSPEGGEWNYDAENRKPADDDLNMPPVYRVEPDEITKEVIALVDAEFAEHFGRLTPFWFGVTPADAEAAFQHFLTHGLPHFGDYQDAMLADEKFLFHSLISLYIHVGLLDPLDVCKRVEAAYYAGDAPLNAVEGYIRQIIGWREYVRGIYWLKMPEYVEENALDANRELPAFYWTAETDMACMRAVISQTRDEAYAHHIQRLMVTGNFALIAGVHPKAVHEWYLAVYADAYEWVELPNTLGMSQFADGGVLASKPYASSGNYINKMSNYCASCRYKVSVKTGEGACPFNSLYWHFLVRNREKLEKNPRISRVYSTWSRMADDKKEAYLDTAEGYLDAFFG